MSETLKLYERYQEFKATMKNYPKKDQLEILDEFEKAFNNVPIVVSRLNQLSP